MRTVLVTGGAGGIGEAIVRALAGGWSVAVHANRSAERAGRLCEELRASGKDAEAFFGDLRDPDACEAAVSAVQARFGRVDALVNCAGVSLVKLFSDCTEADYDAVMDLNFRAAVRMTRLVLPGMLKKNAGRIVNISSMWGLSGASGEVLYSASKAALIGFSRALGKELARTGVLVACVAPGAVDTRMNDCLGKEDRARVAEDTPAGRFARPEEIAASVRFLLEQDAFLQGAVLAPDGGFL